MPATQPVFPSCAACSFGDDHARGILAGYCWEHRRCLWFSCWTSRGHNMLYCPPTTHRDRRTAHSSLCHADDMRFPELYQKLTFLHGAQVMSNQRQPAQHSAAHPSPTQSNPAHPSPSKPNPAQPSQSQPNSAQPRPSQPSPAQPTPAHPIRAQCSHTQPSPSNPSPAHHSQA